MQQKTRLSGFINVRHSMPIVKKMLTTFFEHCKHLAAKIIKNVAIASLFVIVALRMLLPASIS